MTSLIAILQTSYSDRFPKEEQIERAYENSFVCQDLLGRDQNIPLLQTYKISMEKCITIHLQLSFDNMDNSQPRIRTKEGNQLLLLQNLREEINWEFVVLLRYAVHVVLMVEYQISVSIICSFLIVILHLYRKKNPGETLCYHITGLFNLWQILFTIIWDI